jgi:hypothetical protein
MKCRKFRKGNVPYSAELQQARDTIGGWLLLLKHKQGLKVSSRKLSRTLKKAGIPTSSKADSMISITDQLKTANTNYYKLKRSAAELRVTHLERLANSIANSGNLNQQSVLKQLRLRESQRNTARKIKFLRQKLIKNSTIMVSVNLPDGTSIDITKKKQMEKAIITSNKHKFQQSFTTPFYNHPYNKLFGYQGLTQSAQKVLDGTFVTPINTTSYMNEFLLHTRMPEAIKENPTTMDMTFESYISYWKKAKENTACYPSKFSFATMKAACYNEDLLIMDCIMTRIPLKSGYSPLRWK